MPDKAPAYVGLRMPAAGGGPQLGRTLTPESIMLRSLSLAAPGAALALALVAGRADGQPLYWRDRLIPERPDVARLGGPRVGVTLFTRDAAVYVNKGDSTRLPALISQIGWQFEQIFYAEETGPVVVSEVVVLAGGLDRGAFLPTASALVGLRTPGGTEFGVGPYLSNAGFGLALAAGVTWRRGFLNIPLDVAVAPSPKGARISVLTGFTMQR